MELKTICRFLNEIAPLDLAADWDNVGLLMGNRSRRVAKIAACLTASEDVVNEAVDWGADLLIAHHPVPFRPIGRITDSDVTGRVLLKLAENQCGLYSPHTAWDSAERGINSQIAERLELENCEPLDQIEASLNPLVGTGRVGELQKPLTLNQLVERLRAVLPNCRMRMTVPNHGSFKFDNQSNQERATSNTAAPEQFHAKRVGIACGSAGSMIGLAAKMKCDVFVTGEATYHQCLEAKSRGICMILVGHFASERFAMQVLLDLVGGEYPMVQTYLCKSETDPAQSA